MQVCNCNYDGIEFENCVMRKFEFKFWSEEAFLIEWQKYLNLQDKFY